MITVAWQHSPELTVRFAIVRMYASGIKCEDTVEQVHVLDGLWVTLKAVTCSDVILAFSAQENRDDVNQEHEG
jgi:hypothetical protein